MDNAGWHAIHRARKEDEARWSMPQRGPDGRFHPVEEVGPLPEPFVGGFQPPSPYTPHTFNSALPTPPPKDDRYKPSWPVPSAPSTVSGQNSALPSTEDSSQNTQYLYATQQLAGMTAVERSKNLRVARMDPILQFMCGPLLRYDTVDANGVWHGAALVVTADAGSIYEPHPILTYAWDPDRPPKPAPVQSQTHSRSRSRSLHQLAPHPADPLSNVQPGDNMYDNMNSMGPNAMSQTVPAQQIWVYCGSGGTFTFWRFMIHVPLGPNEMRVLYSVNNGIELGFFVPGRNQNMRWAAYSCNGFSAGVNPDDFRGPGFQSGYDPVWVDLLEKHEAQAYHVLVGGGDQLYCDALVREPEMQEWVSTKAPDKKKNYPLTEEMRFAIDRFYFNHYCQAFRSGAFARANSSIPMLNMLGMITWQKIDGFGSYPDDLMSSSVFKEIGSRGYFFFLLFQCFINLETDGVDIARHPFRSLIIGGRGPFIPFPSHSFLTYLGPQVYMLLLDCRAERKKNQVCSDEEYKVVFDCLSRLPPGVEHLVVQIGIPIAYPRMVFLETALESKLNPLVALGRAGSMGLSGFVNKFNADAELLDDLNDHWTAKSHKRERNWFIEQLQHLAKTKRLRVTFLSGDVHCAAVGVLKTYVKGKKEQDIPPAQDRRYMLNVVTSKPPNGVLTMVGTLATKTHRTLHHLDTDETMLPIFTHDPNGGSPKNKYIMGRRNWCSVDWLHPSGDLRFDIRVEKSKGQGQTEGYAVTSPPPRWTN
ncbi:hypothetical protein BDY19DRAFT_986462 [Irpex rosettiformis]|uniref:Uncharacterized protein n=1 Tax=Irpex rosettiformis TaxID=378272 RepID=A0ACB8TXG6_9APHY|nr:hypothetical protein BDY19DRAFT_986462 [Irpex rosettiformis]